MQCPLVGTLNVVTVHPRAGHTTSDVTIEITEPSMVWCGDLFFNRMFPNYGDAQPALLNRYADQLMRSPETIYVPGHGPIADADALNSYREFLLFVQDAAERDHQAGKSAEDGAKDFQLPESLKDWIICSSDVVLRGYKAWYHHFNTEK